MISRPEMSDLPPFLVRFAEIFHRGRFQCLLVGGSLRDAALGRDVQDFDIATDAHPRQVQKLFRRTIPTGLQHGTVTVLFDGHTLEVTTFRSESGYSDGRRPDTVEFGTSITEDLSRRDFTINAMALDLQTGNFVDPFNGMQDLHERTLRTVGIPADRFREDGLRLLRAVRFSTTLDFTIEAATREAMTSVHDALGGVSAERIRDELLKSLSAERSFPAVQLLHDTGLRPHVFQLSGMHNASCYAATDAMRRIDTIPATSPLLRLTAAILHSGCDNLPHEAERLARALKLSNREREDMLGLLRVGQLEYDTVARDRDVRSIASTLGPSLVHDLCLLSEAAGTAEAAPRAEVLERRFQDVLAEKPPLRVADLAVDGRSLMRDAGLSPGPVIGTVLAQLLDYVLEEPARNEAEMLTLKAREIVARGTEPGEKT